MKTIHRTRYAVVAATAASLALPAAPAMADELGLRIGGGVAIGTLPSSSNSTGAGLGVGVNAGTSGNAGLDLNSVTDDQTSASTNFQSSPLTVPDALDRLSIRGDGNAHVSVIYKIVKTKF
jgi:hypothetical protein